MSITSGPWTDEPDRVEWRDEATGMPCLIRRARLGMLCGYVAVAPGHPWHGLGYSECAEQVDVHGGLTYAASCDGEEGEGICHVPQPGESGDVWWFGFDCGHAGDLVPGFPFPDISIPGHWGTTYRTVEYVQGEVTALAAQLAEAGRAGGC